MPKVSVTLNGKVVQVNGDSTVLDAARQNGIEIPTLCHDPRLKPTAACRLCLVEVEGARGAMPACATPVAEGMVIRTHTEDLTRSRRMALELLLSDHYGDCIAPCQMACPAGVDIQGYIALIANGEYKEALKLIKQSNPLPLSIGRVCPRFCEKKCRRNLVDEPVAINALKRFAADFQLNGDDIYTPEPKPSTGHRVAIVGGGPAGLTAAYYLGLEGHEVTIFEANPELGGMLRYGIPEYRLPKAVLDKEIAGITRLCQEVHCNTALGYDFTIESLREQGYETIFLALGAQVSQKVGAEGENMPGVVSGIGFLRDVALGKTVNIGKRVAVVGGGNTAMDAARTALRLNAGEVSIVYRRTRDEMPANPEEIEQADQEGIHFNFLVAPTKFNISNGRVDSMECIRMTLGEPDSSGRRRPEPLAGSEFTIKVDSVIAAIGQTIDTTYFAQNNAVKLGKRGYINVKEETMETTLEGVFAGGDCTSGPATVVEAIAAGHRVADSINQYLGGRQLTAQHKPYNCSKGELEDIDAKEYATRPRLPRNHVVPLEPEVRSRNFDEIEPGFTEEMAKAETERCLSCGCQDVFECKLRELATEYEVSGKKFYGHKRHLWVRENDHPLIANDPNKCVLCGRCVRICNEIEGIGALGFANRGINTIIEPSLGMPLGETNCDSCGQCISTCPTGALTPRPQLAKPGPWALKSVPTVCPYCGIGCNINLNIVDNKIVNVTSPVDNPVNEGNLCRKGAFNPASLNNLPRLKTPLIKRNNELVEAGWDEAIALAGRGLGQIRDQSGGHRLAVLSSPTLTNEESYLVQKVARVALRTNNIGSLAVPAISECLLDSFGRDASTCGLNDILSADLIIVYGCDVPQDYPIVGLKIRQAAGRGSRLITLNPRQTMIDNLARISLKVNRRTSTELLSAILGYIITYGLVDQEFVSSRTANFPDFASTMSKYSVENLAAIPWAKPAKIIEAIHLYIRARRPVIVVDMNTISPPELKLITGLALATGNVGREGAGILALRGAGNAQGLIDMGVTPNHLPGQESVNSSSARKRFESRWGGAVPLEKGRDTTGILQGIESGEIQGLLVVGGDATGDMGSAIFEVPIFSVLIGTTAPERPPYPDIVLPAANFAESDGTYTSLERRIQRLRRAVTPPTGRQNWVIVTALAASVGYPMDYPTVSSIAEEIASLVPAYRAIRNAERKAEPWPFCEKGWFEFEDGRARFKKNKALEILAAQVE